MLPGAAAFAAGCNCDVQTHPPHSDIIETLIPPCTHLQSHVQIRVTHITVPQEHCTSVSMFLPVLIIHPDPTHMPPLTVMPGDIPVRSQPLSLVAAVARRRSCLRPIGLELFFLDRTAAAFATEAGSNSGSTTQVRQPDLETASQSGAASTSAQASYRGAVNTSAVGITGPCWDAPSAFFTFRWGALNISGYPVQCSAFPLIAAGTRTNGAYK